MYFYILILCLNTNTSMISTDVFFDFTDFQATLTKSLNAVTPFEVETGEGRCISPRTTTSFWGIPR
jgi:hypothetical protein